MGLKEVIERGKELLAGKKEENRIAEADKALEAEKIANQEKEEPKKEDTQTPKTAEELKAMEQADDEDESLLEKEEAELSEEEKTKRAIVEAKRNEESLDKKLVRAQRKFEKRIGKVTGQRKDLERKLDEEKTRIAELESRLAALEQPKVIDDTAKAEEDRIVQLIEEDKELDRKDRREMTSAEWEEWNDEAPLEAQRWVARQESRRQKERDEIQMKKDTKPIADEFVQKQTESVDRLLDKYPNANPIEETKELRKAGKRPEEVFATLREKYPEYQICEDISVEHPDWMEKENFGDLVLKELEKRLENKTKPEKEPKDKMYTEEEVQAKIKEAQEMEDDRVDRIDVSNSSTKVPIVDKVPKNRDEKVGKLEELFEKAGLPKENAAKRLKYRDEQGYSGYAPTDEEKAEKDS